MKLKNLINEMSLPNIKNTAQAIDIIRQAYQSAVVRKQPDVDLYGAVNSAMKYIVDDPAVLKYQKELKMAKAAKRAMQQYRSKVSPNQKKHTTMQKRLD